MQGIIPIVTEYNGQAVTTSRMVADFFGKQHFHVLRDIEALKEDKSKIGFISEEAPACMGR